MHAGVGRPWYDSFSRPSSNSFRCFDLEFLKKIKKYRSIYKHFYYIILKIGYELSNNSALT